jgi:hypothetical protein
MPAVIRKQQPNKVDTPITQQSASPVSQKLTSVTDEKDK